LHEETFVCRCEEVTQEEIEAGIRLGDLSLSAIKKRTRAGMGYCQGKFCKRIIAVLIRKAGGADLGDILPGSIRMPVGPVSLGAIAETESGEDDE
jgi:bacterioferritin-associated ferredoxin